MDGLLLLAVAASYPLYVALYALPRVDDVGPPIPDHYPWLAAAALVAFLGARRTTWRGCVGSSAVLVLAAFGAYTDDAAITGAAASPLAVSAAAVALMLGGHAARRAFLA
jgi:hypothetical protein